MKHDFDQKLPILHSRTIRILNIFYHFYYGEKHIIDTDSLILERVTKQDFSIVSL